MHSNSKLEKMRSVLLKNKLRRPKMQSSKNFPLQRLSAALKQSSRKDSETTSMLKSLRKLLKLRSVQKLKNVFA